MGRTNTLSDGKDILKETTHGNLRIIYKMQAKICRNIFRVYQKQDNFSTELEPREGVVINFIWPYLHQFFIDSHGLNGYGKPLKGPFDRYQSHLEAINNGRDIRQINW